MSKKKQGGDPRMESMRVPPHSIEAEQSVIGSLMIDPNALERISSILSYTDFYRRDHQLIYKAIEELAQKNRPFDAVTIGEWFEAKGLAEHVGGTAYMIELCQTTPSAANITTYAEIVRDKAVLRGLIDVGTSIAEDGFSPGQRETSDLLAQAEQRVFAIAEQNRTGKKTVMSMKDAIKEAFEILQVRYESQGAVTGLPTGYTELDDMTAGFHPSDLIVLAARPAMGKTALALNIAEHAALRADKAVVVFSMEMSANQLAFRLISSIGRINAKKLKTGQLEDEDWAKVSTAMKQLAASKIFIDDEPALSPAKLMSKARRLKREHDIGLVVVDYLQLMTVPGTSENRATEISEISRSLKALAKELNVPVVALSQLNRGLESRADKRPVMSDLRESGAIEQDADMIVFIYRDEYYHKDSMDKGLAEIIISKHRNGPTGTVKLKFFGENTRFDNLVRNIVGTFE